MDCIIETLARSAYLGWFDRRMFYMNIVVYELQVRVGGHNVRHMKTPALLSLDYKS